MSNPNQLQMKGIIIPLDRKELADMILSAVREAITEYRLEASEKAEPVTGVLISDWESENRPSPALLFTYLHEVGEFDYIRPDIKEIFDRICETMIEEEDSPYEILIKKELDNLDSLLLLSLTYSGIACGPVSTTVDYCFDMNYTFP